MPPTPGAPLVLAVVLPLVLAACSTVGERAAGIDTGRGVTSEPCPQALDDDRGCIYLGIISDLSVGPHAPTGTRLTEAQEAFWQRVNEDGGIGGFEVDVETYIRDNEYDPRVHARVFHGIRDDVLALAQTFGSPQTAAIIDALDEDGMLAIPASWTSAWAFEDMIVQSGASYCYEAMNAVDRAFAELDDLDTVMAVHFPGDYGDDAAYGVRAAAEAHGATFVDVPTEPGADRQAGALEAVLEGAPDLLFVSTGPLEMATIVGQAVARGYDGRVLGSGPSWDPGLLDSPAAEALEARFWLASPWPPFGAETPGHTAMREQLGDVAPSDVYTAGWVLQYPLKAAIEAAVEAGDLTRAGLRRALEQLTEVDYEGMLPARAGAFDPRAPAAQAFQESILSEVDTAADTGVRPLGDFYRGPTVAGTDLSAPCYEGL
jgi:ABC-type branched-subunit amino acid transport system substrate-binding protein